MARFIEAPAIRDTYDLVAVGSGFGSLFFIMGFLRKRPNARILILEWGRFNSHEWQIENQRNSDIPFEQAVDNKSGKDWVFTIGLGGGTNCWWAQSPRLHPSDFNLKSQYGVGVDWPLSYDDLVPYYSDAERTLMVAGPEDISLAFRDTPKYPLPPHNMTSADRLLKAAMPDSHFVIPNARLSLPTNDRSSCCATGFCALCPVNAKFTAENSLQHLLNHPQIDICLSAKVERLETEAGKIKAATFKVGERDYKASGDLFVLGANAIYSPFILLRSGIPGHGIGKYLSEKLYVHFEVFTKGLNHFDGGTAQTCFNMSLLDGDHRRTRGGAVIYVENRFVYGLRPEFNRWREVIPISAYIEDIPQESNEILVGESDLPVLKSFSFSDYGRASIETTYQALPALLKALPVERVELREVWGTLGHIQGTTRMGQSITDSVIDRDLVHHTIRNLVVVGSSTFPTTGSVNISTTVAALSLRSADRLTS